ncbi:HEAT repeat domain-containing protein [Vulgatibacter incomptus]|nr:HEAT repeat domain-containing protein [Vulgatibacter incomptus]
MPKPARLWFAILALALAGACSKLPQGVEVVTGLEIEASDEMLAPLGLSRAEIIDRLRTGIEGSGRLAIREAVPKGYEGRTWRARIEILRVRVVPSGNADGLSLADVALRMNLTSSGGDLLRGDGRGHEDLPPGASARRQDVLRRSFDAAVGQAVRQLGVALEAASKTDEELVAALQSPDADRRDFAMRQLGERKSRLAIPALVERLRADERPLQLQAVGALVAIGDQAAAPALIDTSAQRDPGFVVQVIYALGELGGHDAEAYLFTVSTGHPDEAVRGAAAEALENLHSRQNLGRTGAQADADRDPSRKPVGH